MQSFREATGQSRAVLIDQGVIDRAVKAQRAAPTRARRVLVDKACPGLRLVLNADSQSWTYSYRPRGRDAAGKRLPQRTLRLGDLTTHTPAAARTAAQAVKDAVRNGHDPASERRQAAEADRLAKLRELSVQAAADQYTTLALAGGTRHHKHEAAQLRMAIEDMGAAVATAPLGELKKADVYRLLDKHRDHPGTQRHRFNALSRCLQWHVNRDALAINPCAAIPNKDKPKGPAPRDRVYTAKEMQALWRGVESFDDMWRDFAHLMFLVPFRRQECSELTPSSLDAGRGALVLHGVLTKNGDLFTIPLCPAALKIVTRRIAATGKSNGRLFPLNSAGGPMNAWSRFADRIKDASGVEDFGWHDLRRAFNSELAEHDVGDPDTVDACLNHRQSDTRRGVRAVYNRAKLTAKKEAVMNAWGDMVAHAVEHGSWPRETARADNVVPMRDVPMRAAG